MPVTMSLPRDRSKWFNSDLVKSKMDAATIRALARAGGLVRIIARRSMKRRAKPSPAGQPPRVVQGGIKNNLEFAAELGGFQVVVGPVGFGRAIAPSMLEYGGWSATGNIRVLGRDSSEIMGRVPRVDASGFVRVRTKKGHPRHPGWRKISVDTWRRETGKEFHVVKQTTPMKPRPFMAPALDQAKDRIPDEWRGTFK